MVSWIFVAIVALASVFSQCESAQLANKCNDDFIKKIEAFVKVKKLGQIKHETTGREYVLFSTDRFYDGEINCAFTELNSNEVKLITVGATEKKIKDVINIGAAEHDGVVEESGDQPKRVYIYNDDNIIVWYKCSSKGTDGKPEVALKVKQARQGDEIESAVKIKEVKQKIKDELGVELTKEYAYDCDLPKEAQIDAETAAKPLDKGDKDRTGGKQEDKSQAGEKQEDKGKDGEKQGGQGEDSTKDKGQSEAGTKDESKDQAGTSDKDGDGSS